MDKDRLDLVQEIVEACDDLDRCDMLKEADILEDIMVKLADGDEIIRVAFNNKAFKDRVQEVKSMLSGKKIDVNSLKQGMKRLISETQNFLQAMSNKINNLNVEEVSNTKEYVNILQDFQSALDASDTQAATGRAKGILNTVNNLEVAVDQISPPPIVGKFD